MDRGAWQAPWGHEESDMTEWLSLSLSHAHTHTHTHTSMSWGHFLPSLGLQTFSKHDLFPCRRGILVLADNRIAISYHLS